MVKLQESKRQLRVTIPRDIAIIKGWKKSTEVFFIVDSNKNVSLKDFGELGGKKLSRRKTASKK